MGRFPVDSPGLEFRRLLILALLEQLDLTTQQQNFLLLSGKRLVKLAHGIFLECQLALHIDQLLLHIII
jgi:hypothetical protein